MDYNTDLDKQTLVGIMAEVFDDINNDEIQAKELMMIIGEGLGLKKYEK